MVFVSAVNWRKLISIYEMIMGRKVVFKMGLRTKWIRFSLLFLLLVCLLSVSSLALAEKSQNPLALDMVVVIENSHRMNKSGSEEKQLDADGLRFDAASALISMCDTQFSRATYFLFSDKL